MVRTAGRPAAEGRVFSPDAAGRDAMPTQPKQTSRSNPQFLLGRLLHRITTLIIVAANLSLGICHVFADNLGEKQCRPNIVLILADDLGYGDVHCLNTQRGKIATPQLDKLASQGMIFTEAHSGSSVCTPTRDGVLTGRYAWRSRLQSGVIARYEEPLIAADRLTLPAMLKQAGYHTACIGKWHLGFTVESPQESSQESSQANAKKERGKRKGKADKAERESKLVGAPLGSVTHDGPVTRGFDSYFGFHHARMMKSVFENDRVTQLIEPLDMLPTLASRSCQQIAQRAKAAEPFFLYLALSAPHTPIVPNEQWQGKSGLGDYADFVMETDWAVGEVLAAIDRAGIADNTLVFFSSDNGCSPAAGTEKLEQRGHYASEARRGYKADVWDGGHRVPFLVRWPGRVKAGACSSQLICLTDFLATCADVLGIKLPGNSAEDSVSILPALLGSAAAPLRPAVVHHSINGKFAIREGSWKLEFCPGSGGWGEPGDAAAQKQGLPGVQLYDLS
ncbi:MAG TPA: arylsulfatase, partial [Pirellulales bacterium]|nr:arylsulfatase [Pirellulales bacterium]